MNESTKPLLSTVLNEFDDFIDNVDGDVIILGHLNYPPSRVLKTIDPAAYRSQFDEWNHFIRGAGEIDTDDLFFDVDFPS